MSRRLFLASVAALAASTSLSGFGETSRRFRGFPASVLRNVPYIEKTPVADATGPSRAYEAFENMKVGARIHWGSIPSGTVALSRGFFSTCPWKISKRKQSL